MITIGRKAVWGIPSEIKPIQAPAGRWRLRLRAMEPARLRVKTPEGIREFYLEDNGNAWGILHETARNLRPNRKSQI